MPEVTNGERSTVDEATTPAQCESRSEVQGLVICCLKQRRALEQNCLHRVGTVDRRSSRLVVQVTVRVIGERLIACKTCSRLVYPVVIRTGAGVPSQVNNYVGVTV